MATRKTDKAILQTLLDEIHEIAGDEVNRTADPTIGGLVVRLLASNNVKKVLDRVLERALP